MRVDGDLTYEAEGDVDYILSPFIYEDKLRDALKSYKFSGQRAYGILLGNLVADEVIKYDALKEFDCVVPIPLYGTRINERGYNQSEILAEVIAKKLSLPCETDTVFRVRETKRQSGLKGMERIENVKSAFYAEERMASGKRIILVDDIYTMGQTMSACAKALKDAGARAIIGISVAKSKPQKQRVFLR